MRLLGLLLAGALTLIACGTGGSAAVSLAPTGTVQAALASLPTKPAGSIKGYTRDQFGTAWFDEDHNRCDTRNDILQRDLTGVTFVTGSRCLVATGVLKDSYTGKIISFTRAACGRGPPSNCSGAVQIDHRVALGNAWITGAAQLDYLTRRKLANDPLNLVAVDGPSNGAKGDSDASGWLPRDQERCDYVGHQVEVKVIYKLWVTAAERRAMDDVLKTCPNLPIPTR